MLHCFVKERTFDSEKAVKYHVTNHVRRIVSRIY